MLGGCGAISTLGESAGPVVTAEDAMAAVRLHQRRRGIDPAREKLSARKDAEGGVWWVVSWHVFEGHEEDADGGAGFAAGGHKTYQVAADGKIIDVNEGI